MLFAAGGGLITEFISLGLIWKQSKSDLNVKGALWHIIQTFVGSLLIIVTALVVDFTGFILRDSMHLLMEGTSPDVALAQVTSALDEMEGIADVHHVHAWAPTSGRHVFPGHVRVMEGSDPHAVLKSYGILNKRFAFFFITLQVETACLDETGAEAIDITRIPVTDKHDHGRVS
jgi:cobalt-zinc-cadmium efflux system protein